MTKAFARIISEWKGLAILSVDEKIHTLKNKITSRSLKPIFIEHEVKNTISSLKKDFVVIPIDMVTNNVAFICTHFMPTYTFIIDKNKEHDL